MTDPNQRPSISSAPLSVLLPARDAGADLDEVVASWIKVLDSLQREYEIILVDDASSDGTGPRCDALAAQYPRLRVLHHASRLGLGSALRTGIAASGQPLLLCTTCDKQYQPEDLRRLLENIDNVDLVTGYRIMGPVPPMVVWLDRLYRLFARVFLGASLEPRDCWLGWSGWRRRWAARWLFGIRVRDPECAFRLFRRDIFRRIPIRLDGDLAQIEILAKANFIGCWMAEVPVTCLPPKDKTSAAWDPPRPLRKELRPLFSNPDFGPVNPDAVATSLTLRSSVQPAIFGQPLTFTAAIHVDGEGLGTPAGVVSFRDGDTKLGTVELHGKIASMTAAALSVGSHTIAAVYHGNREFRESTSPVLDQRIDPVPTITTISSSSASAQVGQPVILTATVKAEYAEKHLPQGRIAFRGGGRLLETVVLNGDSATFAALSLSSGVHSLSAAYEGDSRFGASESPAVAVSIVEPETA